jgi:hypothetical protein
VYAILNSNSYRMHYMSRLRTDLPRVPLRPSTELADKLVERGNDLISLHLLESPILNHSPVVFRGTGDRKVTNVSWVDGTVWLDAPKAKKGSLLGSGHAGFHGVPENVWNFHVGGYQVCEKWLKDRKGKGLSDADIDHYQKVVVALTETIRLTDEIDELIEAHGGWPGAFRGERPGVSEASYHGERKRLRHQQPDTHAPTTG